MKTRFMFAALLLASTSIQAATLVGVDTTGIDSQVKPGDDFDVYANGAWREATEIPADRASTGTFHKRSSGTTTTRSRSRSLTATGSISTVAIGAVFFRHSAAS